MTELIGECLHKYRPLDPPRVIGGLEIMSCPSCGKVETYPIVPSFKAVRRGC